MHATFAAAAPPCFPMGMRSDPNYREHMEGMSSIEKAVADSPSEDYQAIGQAAKKQVKLQWLERSGSGPPRGRVVV